MDTERLDNSVQLVSATMCAVMKSLVSTCIRCVVIKSFIVSTECAEVMNSVILMARLTTTRQENAAE